MWSCTMYIIQAQTFRNFSGVQKSVAHRVSRIALRDAALKVCDSGGTIRSFEFTTSDHFLKKSYEKLRVVGDPLFLPILRETPGRR